MPTTSFSHVLCHRKFIIIGVNKYFFAWMTSCAERYDVIYHPFPINSQYLKMWGVDSPEDITQTIWSTKLEHTKTLASLKNNDSFSDSRLWDRLLKLEICYHKNLPKLKAVRINRNISQRVKIQWKKKNEKKNGSSPARIWTCTPTSSSAKSEASVSPRSSPLGTFRVEERLRLSDRNSILMT